MSDSEQVSLIKKFSEKLDSNDIPDLMELIVCRLDSTKNEHSKMFAKLSFELEKLSTKVENYIKEDNEWKQDAKNVIELGKNVRGFNKIFLYILGIFGSIGMAWGFIKYIATLIINH